MRRKLRGGGFSHHTTHLRKPVFTKDLARNRSRNPFTGQVAADRARDTAPRLLVRHKDHVITMVAKPVTFRPYAVSVHNFWTQEFYKGPYPGGRPLRGRPLG